MRVDKLTGDALEAVAKVSGSADQEDVEVLRLPIRSFVVDMVAERIDKNAESETVGRELTAFLRAPDRRDAILQVLRKMNAPKPDVPMPRTTMTILRELTASAAAHGSAVEQITNTTMRVISRRLIQAGRKSGVRGCRELRLAVTDMASDFVIENGDVELTKALVAGSVDKWVERVLAGDIP